MLGRLASGGASEPQRYKMGWSIAIRRTGCKMTIAVHYKDAKRTGDMYSITIAVRMIVRFTFSFDPYCILLLHVRTCTRESKTACAVRVLGLQLQ